MTFAKIIYQWRKHFFSRPTRNRESSMSAGITCSQSFAEIICWLFAGGAQFSGQVCILLLLLHKEICQENVCKNNRQTVKIKGKVDYQTQWLQGHLRIYFICLNICLNNSTGDRTFRVLPIKMLTTPSDII